MYSFCTNSRLQLCVFKAVPCLACVTDQGQTSWWCHLPSLPPQNTVHFLPPFLIGRGQSTARMASSKTVFSPRCVRAEHSRYLTAPATVTAKDIRIWSKHGSFAFNLPILRSYFQNIFILVQLSLSIFFIQMYMRWVIHHSERSIAFWFTVCQSYGGFILRMYWIHQYGECWVQNWIKLNLWLFTTLVKEGMRLPHRVKNSYSSFAICISI